MKVWGILSVFILALLLAADAQNPKLVVCSERTAKDGFGGIYFDQLNTLNFEALEKAAANFRKTRALFPDGTPRLGGFYRGLDIDARNETEWQTLLGYEQKWVEAYPKSPTPLVARARTLISYAWFARGSGSSNTVSEQGWKLFGERIKLAEADLLRAQKLSPVDPYAYGEFIIICKANSYSSSVVEGVVKACDDAFPGIDYPFKQAASYYLPRWSGSEGDVERFAARWARRRGPKIYTYVYEGLTGSSGAEQEVNLPWAELQKGYEARLKASRNSLIVKNAYARAAVMHKSDVVARQLVREIGENWDPVAWDGNAEFYGQILRWASR